MEVFVKNWARCIAPMVQCWSLKSPAIETTLLIYKKYSSKSNVELFSLPKQISKYDGTAAADVTKTAAPYFCNNVLHSLFSDCTVSANGLKRSNANGIYAHKSFIETAFSYNKDTKNTWLACQSYSYEENPGAFSTTEVNRRKALVIQSNEFTFYGKVAVGFFTCDMHLMSGVTLRIAFRRSIDVFVIISDDAAKHYKVKIVEANLYVRKMTLNDDAVSANEKTLLTSPASYPYLETVTKTFLASTGLHSCKQEDIFAREPIRDGLYV